MCFRISILARRVGAHDAAFKQQRHGKRGLQEATDLGFDSAPDAAAPRVCFASRAGQHQAQCEVNRVRCTLLYSSLLIPLSSLLSFLRLVFLWSQLRTGRTLSSSFLSNSQPASSLLLLLLLFCLWQVRVVQQRSNANHPGHL